MRKLSLSGATRDCYHRTHARRMKKKKKKRLKISNAVVLETRLRQYVLVSLLSSNFIGCTLFLCFIFFLFAPTFFFFAALSAGNCVRIYFKISVEYVVHHRTIVCDHIFTLQIGFDGMGWERSRLRLNILDTCIWSAHMWVCDLHTAFTSS